MSLLSALLSQDQVVSPKAIDEAIQRQVISGGDFETCLLELGAIGEDTLAAYSAAIHGIPVCPREDVADADPAAIARVPAALATRHQVVPLRMENGRFLVAVAVPLDPAVRVELEAAARMPVELRCITSVRLAWALWRYYQIPLAPRIQRLIARVQSLPPGPIPSELSIPLTRPRVGADLKSTPARISTAALAALDAALHAALHEDDRPPSLTPPPHFIAASRPSAATSAYDAVLTSRLPDAAPASIELVAPPTPIVPPRSSVQTAPMARASGTSSPTHARVEPTAALAALRDDDDSERTVIPEGDPTPRANVIEAPRDVVNVVPRRSFTPPMPFAPPAVEAPVEASVAPPIAEAPDQTPPPLATPARSLKHAAMFLMPSTSPAVMESAMPDAPAPVALAPSMPSIPPVIEISMPSSLPPPPLMIPQAPRLPSPPFTRPLPDDRRSLVPAAPRGIPLELALQRLDASSDRDAVVDVMLDHAHSRFNYVALLVVHGDRCAGLSSRGPGLTEAPLRDLSFSLARPSILRLAHDAGVMEVIAVEPNSGDAELRALLQRDEAQEVIVAPVRIGAKVALLLWADTGAFSPSALAARQLALFVQRCAETFSRIIATRKRGMTSPRSPREAMELAARTITSDRAPRPDRGARLDAFRKALGSTPAAEIEQDPAGGVAPEDSAADECARIVEEAQGTGAISDDALTALVGHGELGLDAVFARFPGVHTLQRGEALVKLPVIEESGVLLRVVVAFRHAALPRLLEALTDEDPDARFCALLCLGEVVHPSAIPALLSKLTDGDYPTRMAAIEVLRNYRRFDEFEAVGRAMRDTLRDANATGEQRRAAAHALGELRDTESVAALVSALTDPDAALATAAHRALVVLTRQDFGATPEHWMDWWNSAGARHRIEWLIDALMHGEPTIRHEASEELKRITGQYFGYYFNLPRRDREKGWQRYVEWWKAEGAQRFDARTSRAPRSE